MIRRLSAVLIGLALTLPLTVASVSAHTNLGAAVTNVDAWTDGAGDTHVTGLVTNHTGSRLTNIQVTATWVTPAGSETATAFVTNLAPHLSSAFLVIEEDTDVSTGGIPGVSATGTSQGTKPTGGLSVDEDNGVLVGDTWTVTVTNDSTTAATGVRVSALRTGGTNNDAAISAAANLAAGASADFDIVFDDESDGGTITGVMATTTSGSHTSWNNFFSDLGSTTTSFIDPIAWMADEGITTGCGNGNFCPKAGVTRAQMAVFLARGLGLDTAAAPDAGFEDIAGLSQTFQDAINAIADAGITAGCSTDPFNYCPNQVVTRGQMSKFIVVGYSLGTASEPDQFTDDDGDFSEPYNDRMAELGITSGCGATTYCPNSSVLREQMAVFMYRADQIVLP